MEKGKTILLLTIALIARLAVFWFAAGGNILVGEGRVYNNLAINIMEGRGFSLSRDMLDPPEKPGQAGALQRATFEFYRRVDGFYGGLRPGRPTLFIVPGYPVFMTGVYSVFGQGNFLAVRGVQLLLGLLTVRLGLALASRYLRGRIFLLVGLFMALDPFELYYEAIPATQALFGLLFMAALLLATKALERTSMSMAAASSLVWALAFYVRPVALPILVVFLFCVLLRKGLLRMRLTTVALSSLVFLAALTPWILYSHDVSGQWRIAPTQGGVNLWEGCGRIFSSHFENENVGASSLYGPLRSELLGRLDKPWLAEFPEFRDESEWVRDSILTRRTIDFMAANPALLPRLVSLRFTEFFKPFPFNEFPLFYMLSGLATFGVVLLFAGAGLLRVLRRRDPASMLLSVTVLIYTLVHLASISGTPHRVALDFPLAILAGVGSGVFLNRSGLAKKWLIERPGSNS